MEESPPSSPPHVRDPDSHDRESSPECPADLGHQRHDDHHEDDGDHLPELDQPSSDHPGFLSDELKARIVKQVEYYFSDENLLNDQYLPKYIRTNKEGFVPLAVIASFRRMRKLVQDVAFIATALSTSTQLVVSSDGKKVKRIHPYLFPSTNNDDALSCTVLVDNLPEDHSMENIQRIFGSVGNVKHVSIRQPYSTSRAPAKKNKQVFATRGKWHAFIEYETVEAAEKAVMLLNDGGNWRTGMRVQLLVQQGKKHDPASGGSKVVPMDNDSTLAIGNTHYNHNLGTDDHLENPEAEGLEHSLSEKDEGRGRRGGQGRGRGQHHIHGRVSKVVYVKKHDMPVAEVEVNNSVDVHDEKPEIGGEHLMNEKDGHRGPRTGRGRNHMQHCHNAQGSKGSSYGNDHHNAGEPQSLESLKTHTQTIEVEKNISSERGGWGARWRGRGRGRGHHHFDAEPGHGSSSGATSGTNETTIKHHPPVPKMPDGTRGFTMGRGRPPSTSNVIG